jgi:hypothetical protein
MRRRAFFVSLLAGTLFLAYGALGFENSPGGDAAEGKHIGTWKLTSAKYDGQQADLAELGTTLKHITPGNFMWVSYKPDTGEVTRSAGGTYKLDGDNYEETPRYGLSADFDAVKDKQHTFTIKIEGDTLHQDGKLSSGLKIEEVWERVK